MDTTQFRTLVVLLEDINSSLQQIKEFLGKNYKDETSLINEEKKG